MVEQIQFDERNGKHGKQLGIYMRGGFWVPKGDVLMAWKNAAAHYPLVDWGLKVCAATFFDYDEWKAFPFGKQLALGRCIRFFSDQEMLPIEVANPGKKGKRFYRLRQ